MDIKIQKLLLTVIFTALMTTVGTTHADDTDVYINPGSGLPAGSEPMVMFSLDYRPNLGSTACTKEGECDVLDGYMDTADSYTFFDVLRGSLRKVFQSLEGVRVGLMLNHDHLNNCAGLNRTKCSNGGYIAMGFELFDEDDTNGAKERFHSILKSVPTPHGGLSHPYQGKELFFELFRYLTGQNVFNGHNGYADYNSNDITVNLDVDTTWDPTPPPSWDTSIEDSENRGIYNSPYEEAGACSMLYSVNFMFQVSNQDDDSDAEIAEPISSGGFGTSPRTFPDVIKYLNDVDLANGTFADVPDLDDKQNLISYFIVDETKINTTTKGYARAGGTGVPLALSSDPTELIATLEELFKQILSVSTTFVAASVPVNVFNRAEITDNVFIALFQVDGQGKPYWVGNVKKLRLDGVNDSSATAALVDATGTPAVAGDGRIRFDALTYWTDSAALPAPDLDNGEVAGRDGRSVARGGAGQKTPGLMTVQGPQEANGQGGRRIYYDQTASVSADFDVDATLARSLQADFGAATEGEALELIKYARGLDVDDIDGDGETPATGYLAMRYIHGPYPSTSARWAAIAILILQFTSP